MKQDLTGQRFGSLTVVKRSEKGDLRHRYWVCRCDCGQEKDVEESHLKNGHTKSCGCYRKKVRAGILVDISGMRFGKLTAVGAVPGKDGREDYWLCRCDCGNWMVCRREQLKQGHLKKCGFCGEKKAPADAENGRQRIEGRKLYINNTSGRKGVYKKGMNRWRASIGFHGKVYHLGTFQTYEEAVTARQTAEAIFCGCAAGDEKTGK